MSKFWNLAIAGAVFGAVTSQSLLDLFTVLMFFGFIKELIEDKEKTLSYLYKIGIEWAFVGYFLVVLAGYYFNASADAEISWNLKKFIWIPTLYLFIYAFLRSKLNIKSTVWYFATAFLVPNLYAVATYYFKYDFITKVPIQRIIGLLDSATYHAHANAIPFVMFLVFVYAFWKKSDLKIRTIFLASVSIFILSILFTMTRGIWLSVVLSTALVFTYLNIKTALKIGAALALLLITVYFTLPDFKARVNLANSEASTNERLDLINVNIQMFKEYPVLGIGYGENLRRNREYWDQPNWNKPENYITSHAHNQYLNVLSTTGILGYLFFISFFIYFLVVNLKLIRIYQKNEVVKYTFLLACLTAQIEFWLACLTDVSFEYAKIRSLILLVWALVIAIKQNPKFLENDINP